MRYDVARRRIKMGSSGDTSSGLPSKCVASIERRLELGARLLYAGGRGYASITLLDGGSSLSKTK